MQATSSPQFDETPRHIPVDTEHFGIRLLIPLLALAGAVGGVVLGRVVAAAVDESLGSLCFSLSFAVIGIGVMLQIGERVIKPNWRSGRHLEVNTSHLTSVDTRRSAPQTNTIFRWHDELDVMAYFWEVETGKSRVRKGWYCTAVQLRQDDNTLLLYTFVSPETAGEIPRFQEWFFRLLPKKRRESLQTDDPRAAAKQERFRKIESHRWFDGAELTEDHFIAVMGLISEHGSVQERNRR